MKTAYIPRYRRAAIANMIASGALVRTKGNSGRKFFWNDYVAALNDDGVISGGGSGSTYQVPYVRKETIITPGVPDLYQEPAPVIDPNAPEPLTQYMDMDEFRAISEEGIVIPPGSNVVVIPVSQSGNTELYNSMVAVAEANPGASVADVVSIVLNPDTSQVYNVVIPDVLNPDTSQVYNVVIPDIPLPVVEDTVKIEVINNQQVVEVKENYPGVALVVIEKAIDEGNFTSVINPVVTDTPPPVSLEPVQALPISTLVPGLMPGTLKEQNIAKDKEEMYISGAAAVAGILVLLLL